MASETEQTSATAWDRRVVRSLEIANSAHTGVRVLRWVALLTGAAAVIGTWLYTYAQDDLGTGQDDFGSDVFEVPDKFLLGQFLSNIALPLAFSGMVLGLSFLLAVHAARLDLDIVLADNEESDRSAAEDPN